MANEVRLLPTANITNPGKGINDALSSFSRDLMTVGANLTNNARKNRIAEEKNRIEESKLRKEEREKRIISEAVTARDYIFSLDDYSAEVRNDLNKAYSYINKANSLVPTYLESGDENVKKEIINNYGGFLGFKNLSEEDEKKYIDRYIENLEVAKNDPNLKEQWVNDENLNRVLYSKNKLESDIRKGVGLSKDKIVSKMIKYINKEYDYVSSDMIKILNDYVKGYDITKDEERFNKEREYRSGIYKNLMNTKKDGKNIFTEALLNENTDFTEELPKLAYYLKEAGYNITDLSPNEATELAAAAIGLNEGFLNFDKIAEGDELRKIYNNIINNRNSTTYTDILKNMSNIRFDPTSSVLRQFSLKRPKNGNNVGSGSSPLGRSTYFDQDTFNNKSSDSRDNVASTETNNDNSYSGDDEIKNVMSRIAGSLNSNRRKQYYRSINKNELNEDELKNGINDFLTTRSISEKERNVLSNIDFRNISFEKLLNLYYLLENTKMKQS